MTNQELSEKIFWLVQNARIGRSCIKCTQFEESTEICRLAGSRPPARIIVLGCEKYSEEPPF